MIKIAKSCGIISSPVQEEIRKIADYRNVIHPTIEIRNTGLPKLDELATLSTTYLQITIEDLKKLDHD